LRPTTLPRRAAPPRTRRPPRLRAAATTLPARGIRVQRRPRATTPTAPCRKLHRRFPCSASWASAPWPRAWSAASASNNSHATSSSGPVASRMAGPDLFVQLMSSDRREVSRRWTEALRRRARGAMHFFGLVREGKLSPRAIVSPALVLLGCLILLYVGWQYFAMYREQR